MAPETICSATFLAKRIPAALVLVICDCPSSSNMPSMIGSRSARVGRIMPAIRRSCRPSHPASSASAANAGTASGNRIPKCHFSWASSASIVPLTQIPLLPFASDLAARGPHRLFLQHRKLNLLLHRINPVHQHPNLLPQMVRLARPLPDNLARVLVVGVAIVSQSVQRHQSLHKQIREFDKESEFG